MLEKFRTQAPYSRFLILLVSYFAVLAAFSVFRHLLASGWLPSFDITINGHVRSLSTYVLTLMDYVLQVCIFVNLLRDKELGLNVASKVGVVLLMFSLLSRPVTECLYLCISHDSLLFTIIPAAFSLLYIAGMLMFINGSPADRKLKRLVRWTPFLPLIIMSASSMISPKSAFGPETNLVYVAVDLAIFLAVYRLAKTSRQTA